MLRFFARSSEKCDGSENADLNTTGCGSPMMSSITTPSTNRSLSIRSNHRRNGSQNTSTKRTGFSFNSLRGNVQPELSRKLYRIIKSENNLITAHETAGRERISIATQLSEWGEQTNDAAVSDVSDKVGVILSELGEQEDQYAHSLDDARGVLKHIRNTEKSVQPSRDGKDKIADDIAKLKMKEPQSAKLVVLEQELVRAEAENLVAEAQLTNITRQKLKEAYEAEFAATIERAEKQIILAKHGRRLLQLLDDTPVVPGDMRPAYHHAQQARQILNDAEDDLRDWRPEQDDYAVDPSDSVSNARGKQSVGHDDDAHIVASSATRNKATQESDAGSAVSDGTRQGEVLAAH
ncbi:sphingolipid long chain base-responsive protein LSP1 [Colletotrichum graminicola M1.001]|uniref:Sphingolipid long chain base-responsive protein LSP1 n=1 Tax=Colletotrichum graminicola (strain M1.001 / M2 / FGSC 10212) TaxID=645133 RepID=E3Q621_COLGM|nr:sphingolipid long chain base-responsive protein LSP1 [Colletotrichum graminicola M1.001]EFQ26269.1 sphingolipid long chain base-responsive protein LSP1 [Colletotrichum graminicola M1.001]